MNGTDTAICGTWAQAPTIEIIHIGSKLVIGRSREKKAGHHA
jgi:hypothetical protein